MIIERLSEEKETIIVGFGCKKDDFFSISAQFPSILLTNPNDPWFATGIDGMDECYVSYKIDSVIQHYKQSIFVGEGTASYGAIFYGGMCGAHKIFAFSPHTLLSPYTLQEIGDNRYERERTLVYEKKGKEPEILDLPKIFRNFSRCYAYCSTESPICKKHVSFLTNAIITNVKCDTNNLMWWVFPRILKELTCFQKTQ